jgi:Mg2+ and Co2+ transporter CorA
VIRVYTVVKRELSVHDIKSQQDMDDLTHKFKQAWVDCWDLDKKEIKIISGILGTEPKALVKIKEDVINPKYSKCFDEGCLFYTNISTPVVEFTGRLRLHPFHIFLKKRFLVTLRSGYSSRLVDSTIRTFRVLDLNERKPSLILAKLIHEIIDENSGATFSIRELIDKIEGEAMESHKKGSVMRSIFRLKRQLSTFHRLLWAEKELLSDVSLGVIPNLKLVGEAQRIIDDASDDITRELEFLGYYDNSLDSILNLLNLGSIHGVERILVFLTVALVILTFVLIGLELAGSFLH